MPTSLNKKHLDFVNWLNVFLMLGSLVLAYVFPFEVFLLAYAILGPLHYLTEIHWLHKRNYFLKAKADAGIFLFMAVLILLGLLGAFASGGGTNGGAGNWLNWLNGISPSLIFAGFLFGFAALFIKKGWVRWVFFAVLLVVSIVLGFDKNAIFILIFASLLPTMIHVLVFTGMFLLVGAKKSKSLSAYISLAVFLLCVGSFFVIGSWNAGSVFISNFSINNANIFLEIEHALSSALNFKEVFGLNALIASSSAVALMKLIAFAYIYHYLNWFSKTTVIGWGEISKKGWQGILIFWILSVGLYFYNYQMGFVVLYLLSMLHVFLEFPLDHKTFLALFSKKAA